jgi:hypothetical protein
VLFASCDEKSASNGIPSNSITESNSSVNNGDTSDSTSDSTNDSTVAEHVHNYGEWTETKEATCTEDGEEIRVCAEDATHTESRATERLGHDYANVICSRCGKYIPEYTEISPDGLIFMTNSTGTAYSFTSYAGDGETVVVPAVFNGLPVTSIAENAFVNCTVLKSVTIENGITSIGKGAFSGCNNLESITLPFIGENADGTGETYFGYIFGADNYNLNAKDVPISLKNVIITGGNAIPRVAFWNCRGLTSVTIPNSITSIGSYAFSGCNGLTGVYISDLAAWCNISFDGYLYSNAFSNPLYYAHNLYLNNELITELTIPDGVTSIGGNAFYYCSSLTKVDLGNKVTTIGAGAFGWCVGLTSITIPENVIQIDDGAFKGCNGLKSIEVSEKNTVYHSAGNCLIQTKSKVLVAGTKTSEIPNDGSVTTIGKNAFNNWNLKSIEIPSSITSIEEGAFLGCSILNSVTIGDGVTSIGDQAFFGCSAMKSVTIGKSVKSIGKEAFDYCDSLTSVEFKTSNGWWYAPDGSEKSGTSIASSDLADSAMAAKYLTSTYCNYYWKRS